MARVLAAALLSVALLTSGAAEPAVAAPEATSDQVIATFVAALDNHDLRRASTVERRKLDRFQPRQTRQHGVKAIEAIGGLIRRVRREKVQLGRRRHVELGAS